MFSYKKILCCIIFSFCISMPMSYGEMNVIGGSSLKITATVFAPKPCETPEKIDVDFGYVDATDTSNSRYKRNINYTAVCEGESEVILTFTGNIGSLFNSKILRTDKANLGIQLYVDGVKWDINTPRRVDTSVMPKIEAVLVTANNATLTGGYFTSSATLLIETN